MTGTAPAGALLPIAEDCRRLQSAHVRHLQVHQHDVEAAVFERGQRLNAIARQRDPMTLLLQQTQGQFLIDHAVLDQQNVQWPQRRLGNGTLAVGDAERECLQRRPIEHDGEVEGAALTQPTLHPQPPSHHPHQALRDGQTQAGAAVLARRRAVRLLEGPEDRLLFVRRDADARVAHLKMQNTFGLLHAHRYDHLTLGGELDAVADQVDEDLAQPSGIADQHLGHVLVAAETQAQALVAVRATGTP